MKKGLLLLSCIALIGSAMSSAPAAAEQRGITCALEGTAKLSPGLTSEGGDYKITFTGDLTNCQSTGDASSGTVKATAKVSGNCAYTASEGTASIKWDNGHKTAVTFSTEDVGVLVALDYTVGKSNEPAAMEGDQGYGLLVFQADPTLCDTEEGITEADFDGQLGSGSPS